MGYSLGIDLGTTFTAAALIRNDRAEMASLGVRGWSIPSVVFVGPDDEVIVGDPAIRRAGTDPQRVAREFKRRLGDPIPVMVGGSPISAERLSGMVLSGVVEQIASLEGGNPDHIVVTHPANWGPYKTDLLRQAIRLSEVDQRCPTSLMSEPEAAAVHYAATERLKPGEVVAVYDLGGGTFDAAVLRRTTDSWEFLGPVEGIERLGGIDLDEAIFRHVDTSLDGQVLASDPVDPTTVSAIAKLRRDCVDAKEALSSDTAVTISVALPELHRQVQLTRSEFEAMIRPTLVATIEALQRALRSADVEPADLRSVLLVGGSSRIPLVGEILADRLRVPLAVDTHPKNSVALGAAVTAHQRAAAGYRDGAIERDDSTTGPVVGTATAVAPPISTPPVRDRTRTHPRRGRDRSYLRAADGRAGLRDRPVRRLRGTDRGRRRADCPSAGPAAARWSSWPPVSPSRFLRSWASFSRSPGPETRTVGPPQRRPRPMTAKPPRTPARRAATAAAGRSFSETERGNVERAIWQVNLDGGEERSVIDSRVPPAADGHPTYSDDGRFLAYLHRDGSDDENWELIVGAPDGTGANTIAEGVGRNSRPSWSPDETEIVIPLAGVGGTNDLWIINVNSGQRRQLTQTPDSETDPAWSSTGDRILFRRDVVPTLDAEIFVISVADGAETRLTNHPGFDGDPHFSPDDSLVLFTRQVDSGSEDIFTMSPTAGDAGELTNLTNHPAKDQDPMWHPDGDRVVWQSQRDAGDPEIYVMNADGSDPVRLTFHAGLDGVPDVRGL